ncbi:hypothetical protein [Pseudomonas protegens]|uniref:hypothetical protein n=1 Tax=Pseudomonas protegens TaxID=380021 RepID=UPI001B320171|nr:hypothetical protein [Pseudomonas protegens]
MGKLKFTPELLRIRQTMIAISSKEGWVAWDGGDCPLNADDEICAILASGAKTDLVLARHLDWKHWGSGNDIASYKVIHPAEKSL